MPTTNTILLDTDLDSFVSTSAGGGAISGAVADLWTIGSSEEARLIQKIENLPIDYIITSFIVTCSALSGGTGFIRIYQKDRESEAAYLEIPAAQTNGYSVNPNLIISEAQGERTIIIDAYDPSDSAHNTVQITGKTYIIAKPYIAGTANTATSS